MRLIDLDNDILVEPKKKIIESTTELNSNVVVPTSFDLEKGIDNINRRDFLIYMSVAMAGTVIPTPSQANPVAVFILRQLVLKAIDMLTGFVKQIMRQATNEMKKRGIQSLSNAGYRTQNKVIDTVVDLLSIYFKHKISKKFIKEILVEYNVLERLEAIWNIDSSNQAEVSFTNPTNKTIYTKLEMYIKDEETNSYDKKSRLLRYKRKFLLSVKPNEKVNYDIEFDNLPKKGIKKVIIVGNESAKNLKIQSSGNIFVSSVFI